MGAYAIRLNSNLNTLEGNVQVKKIKQFKKLSGDDTVDHVVIAYSDGSLDVVLHTSGERAAPDFYKLFEELVPQVCMIAEFGDSEAGRTRVRSVSLSYHEDKETGDAPMSVIFACERRLVATPQPLIFNTPSKFEQHNDQGQRMTNECLGIVNALVAEAEEYIDGKREQTQLALPEAGQ